ncbi:MAG: tRNA-dihydrouridine synthase family protein [Desulfobacteraceae bacterium]|jgi:tRNA-dihydrouridine synthase
MMTFQICLAPLKGITDALFRTTFAEFFNGVDRAVAPFLSTTSGPRIKPSLLKELLPENNRTVPVVPQVMSKRAENFLPLAMALRDLGYDTINWNLGCPAPMVAKKGRGSGLLSNPEAIERFLDKVLAVMPHRLSIKMRLGRHRVDEIFELLPILDRYPLKEVIIHPRTGVQMYKGVPQLDIFEQCLARCRHPVVYNGDIVAPESFNRLRHRFPGIHGWMIGRGAVSDPFLCSALKGQVVDGGEKRLLFRQFHDALYSRYACKLYGPSHLLNRMKGLWSYFVKSIEEGRALQKKINKARNVRHYEDVVDAFFDNDPKWTGLNDTLDSIGESTFENKPSSGKEDRDQS